MSYNYRKEFAKFKREWEKQEKIMRESGMSEEAIAELYDFSHEQFKGDRNYDIKKCDIILADIKIPSGTKSRQGMTEQPPEFDDCFGLIEQIESPKLLNALRQLSESEYDLLCMVIIDDLSGRDIAAKLGQSPSSVSQKLTNIKKLLKKFL